MDNSSLIEKSPIRLFEKELNLSLEKNEIGVIVSEKGMGKTSVLVQIGLDYLLFEKQIVHISFNQNDDSVLTWYSNIFYEITKKTNIKDEKNLKENLFKNRILLNFNKNSSIENMINSLNALKESGIKIQLLLIDDFDFKNLNKDDFDKLLTFAKKQNIKIWVGTSISNSENDLSKIFGENIEKKLDIIINLEQSLTGTNVKVLKLKNQKIPESKIIIDSRSLLIKQK